MARLPPAPWLPTCCTSHTWLHRLPRRYFEELRYESAAFRHQPYTVIEADEFDRSFHWLSPWMSVITATDPDHLDIYGTKEAYLESFRHYTTLIQPGGA